MLAFGACGHGNSSYGPTVRSASPSSRVVLVATERVGRGARLVGVSIDGARQTEITSLDGEAVFDRSPVISPNGKWIVFASNRLRKKIGQTSLWLISANGSGLRRLSEGDATERDPRISADGRWLYFCSNRRGSYDLYRSAFNSSRGSVGESAVVVESDGQILSPGLSPDGRSVVFMELDKEGASRLWRATVKAGTRSKIALTQGPADMTPSWGPRGLIAFAARAQGRDDADVFIMPAVGGERVVVASTPVTDETGPRWSRDGRFLFAIGMYSSPVDGQPLFGSVIALDREESSPHWRALHDPSAVETRVGVGLLPGRIDFHALRRNQDYLEALKEVLWNQALRNENRR